MIISRLVDHLIESGFWKDLSCDQERSDLIDKVFCKNERALVGIIWLCHVKCEGSNVVKLGIIGV